MRRLIIATLVILPCVSKGYEDRGLVNGRAIELIKATARPMERGNPLALIRVVNYLQSLGKEKAIEILMDYSATTDLSHVVVDLSGNAVSPITEHDDQQVCMIIPLLFEPPNRDLPPPPEIWFDPVKWRWKQHAFPICLEGDIPFDTIGEITLGGRPPAPTRALVEWAAKHGLFRKHSLSPVSSPLEAADNLVERISTGRIVDPPIGITTEEWLMQIRRDLRRQALSMIPDWKDGIWQWDLLRERESNLRWDEERQSYVFVNHYDRGS